jgi:hypothetical protein
MYVKKGKDSEGKSFSVGAKTEEACQSLYDWISEIVAERDADRKKIEAAGWREFERLFGTDAKKGLH